MLVPFKFLWLPAISVAAFGFWILARVIKVRPGLAVLLAFLRVAIPFLYFAYFFRSGWNLLDDLDYINQAQLLMSKGNNPFLIFFTPDGREKLLYVAGGHHILYYWWNLLAVYLFGSFYSSPIFLNVGTTFVSAALLHKMARLSGRSDSYSKWLALFFLVHWDVVSWSSFVNLKDALLLMMTLATAYLVAHLKEKKSFVTGIGLVVFLSAFYWIRFYFAELLVASAATWIAFSVKGAKKILWLGPALAGCILAFPREGYTLFRQYATEDYVYGPIRMALTPQPWRISPEYSFLLIPSILHWFFFLPCLAAAVSLWRKNQVFRLASIIAIICIIFRGLVPDLLGPRQRFPVAWVFAWLQFHAIWLTSIPARERLAPSPSLSTKAPESLVRGSSAV